ncbi:rhodanese-like domain-containing protein [Paraclostridium bifermentans]|nr:rhodanese-like domain-containing protein [Paraclostridium bifermentans]
MGFLSNLFKKNKYKTINGNELIDLLTNNKNCIVIDVRTAQEFKSGHIEKAKNISVSELRSKVNSIIKIQT